jgi:hypothetical protein
MFYSAEELPTDYSEVTTTVSLDVQDYRWYGAKNVYTGHCYYSVYYKSTGVFCLARSKKKTSTPGRCKDFSCGGTQVGVHNQLLAVVLTPKVTILRGLVDVL